MAGKFEINSSSKGKFFFNLKASNGQVIFSSEMYESKAAAEKGIISVKNNADNDARYERRESVKGEPFFVLKAGNGEIIGRSETYASTSAMENGIDSVKKNAVAAEIADAA